MDVDTARRARTDAYVAFTRAAGEAMEAGRKHGQGSPQHLAAQAKITPLREAFSEAADAYRAAEAQADLEASRAS